MPKKRETVAELLRRRHADPDWVARRDARERKLAEFKQVLDIDQAELVRALRDLGYVVESVWDLVNNVPRPPIPTRFVGPYERAYPLLVQHLRVAHHRRIREGVIRSLTIKDGGLLVEEALLEQLQSESDPALRWVLANALRRAMPYRRRLKHPEIKAAYSWVPTYKQTR